MLVITREQVVAAQRALAGLGLYRDSIDGKPGVNTRYAVRAFQRLNRLPDNGVLDDKTLIALLSPKRPVPDLEPHQEDAVPPDVPAFRWPREAECPAFYGPPCKPPMVSVRIPWDCRISWDTRQVAKTISIHEKCAASLERVLEAVRGTYSDADIAGLGLNLYGGSFMPRKKRGGDSWSIHAYAAAIDWDPVRNMLNMHRPTARLSHEDAVPWFECWEAEGWTSLGRVANFDYMHLQAARR